MKRLVIPALCTGLGLVALPVHAQQTPSDRIAPPAWAKDPVVEAIGRVRIEVGPNRASFSVSFEEVNRESKPASDKAVARAKAAMEAIRRQIGESDRIQSSVFVEPYYQQYRDGDGTRVQNDRPDRVEGYRASARLDVTLLDPGSDPAAAGRARAAALALGPERVEPLRYFLQASPAQKSDAMRAAVEDGRARAQAMAEAAGGKLGALLVMQEGQGPCFGGIQDAAPRVPMAAPKSQPGGASIPYEVSSDFQPQLVDATVCLVYRLAK